MSYKEEVTPRKRFENNLRTLSDNKNANDLIMELFDQAVEKLKESNLLDHKIDEEGNVLQEPIKPNIMRSKIGYVKNLEQYQNTPTLRQEREELKRLEEENETLNKIIENAGLQTNV